MPRPTRYALRVNLTINREEWSGPMNLTGQPIHEDERGGYWQSTPERLAIEESMDLGGLDFMGVMAVLGKMHDAITAIKP